MAYYVGGVTNSDYILEKIGARYLNNINTYFRSDILIGQTVLKEGKPKSDQIECLSKVYPYIKMLDI